MDHEDKPTILIVDDTPANLAVLSGLLGHEYRIKAAIDGERALRIATDTPPDLVLLDVMMPGLSGYDVCVRLKQHEATRHVPVIFVTAMSETEDETRGLDAGGVDYVTKPINEAIVKARIRTQLALSRHARDRERLIRRLEDQAQQLAQLNHTLEQRVADGIAELERLSRLKRFFSPPVVDLLLSSLAEDPLKTHRREIVAVFVDLRGYTAFTETSDPEDVMSVIGEYHRALGELVVEHAGTLERFAGDGMMIFFNDPLPVDDPADTAVRMALAMRERFTGLAAGWRSRGYDLAMGIGIAQGYATIGAIGFEGRRDYGVIGTVTNLAARLCAEATGGQILISQRVHNAVADRYRTDSIGEIALKGFHRTVVAHAVAGHATVPDTAAAG